MAFLTRQEKFVLLFLILGAICGLSYSYYKKFNPPINIRPERAVKLDPRQAEELDNLLKEELTVNINRAQASELTRLKGVGPALADRIIEYRASNGLFRDKEGLKQVRGIGPKKFNAIKDYISLE